MTSGMAPLTERPAWKSLEAHYQRVRELHLRKLFGDDPDRGERMTAEAVGLYLDYSKNRITDETLKLLVQLTDESGLKPGSTQCSRAKDQPHGEPSRPACRLASPEGCYPSSWMEQNVVPQVHAVLDKMTDFSDRVRSGAWPGHTGKRIRNVINIGIGGSDSAR